MCLYIHIIDMHRSTRSSSYLLHPNLPQLSSILSFGTASPLVVSFLPPVSFLCCHSHPLLNQHLHHHHLSHLLCVLCSLALCSSVFLLLPLPFLAAAAWDGAHQALYPSNGPGPVHGFHGLALVLACRHWHCLQGLLNIHRRLQAGTWCCQVEYL